MGMRKTTSAVLLAAILLAGGGGYYAWQRQQGRHRGGDRQPRRRSAAGAGSGDRDNGRENGTSRLPQRARDGAGLQHGDRPHPGRWPDRESCLQGRPDDQGGGPARPDRCRPYQAALDQANAKKAQDQAALVNTKADLQRLISLGKYATRQQTDTQQTTVNQTTAQIALDQATIDNAATQLSYTTIRAPISGMTGFRQVDVGNIVNAAVQTGIVTIAQIEPISVIFTLPEEQLQDINGALAAGPVPVIAYSTDGQKKLSEGTLSVINNQVDAASGTVRLKATFDNRDHALWPGLSVATRMLVRTIADAIVIPDEAVQHGPNGLYAYVVDAAGKAMRQDIAVSLSADGRSVVSKGLAAGQKVIMEGQYRVQPGALVAAQDQTAKPVAQKAD